MSLLNFITRNKYHIILAAVASLSTFSYQPAFSQNVPYLQLSFWTGTDDLRGGALGFAQITLQNGTRLQRMNLNRGQNWKNNSTHRVRYRLPAGTTLNALHGARVTISHDGAPRNIGESYDNWNLNTVRVDTPRVCTGARIGSASGRPWVRFTGSQKSRSLGFRISPALARTRAPYVNLTLRTGGDDLRGGALAFAQIRLRNGRTLPRVNLNRGRNWRNNSSNSVRLPLPRNLRLGELRSVRISHDGAPRNIGESYDNWNLNAISVSTPRVCSSRNIGITGRQWVRFTGRLKSKSFTLSTR